MAGMERFSQRARRVLSLAHQEAERMRHNTINTEHLLLGLVIEEGGIAAHALRELGLESERVKEMVERLAPIGIEESPTLELSTGAQQALEFAIEEARQSGTEDTVDAVALQPLVERRVTGVERCGRVRHGAERRARPRQGDPGERSAGQPGERARPGA